MLLDFGFRHSGRFPFSLFHNPASPHFTRGSIYRQIDCGENYGRRTKKICELEPEITCYSGAFCAEVICSNRAFHSSGGCNN
jgi:hypothetical protein